MYRNHIQRKIHSRGGFHEDCVRKESQFVLRSAQNVNNTVWAERGICGWNGYFTTFPARSTFAINVLVSFNVEECAVVIGCTHLPWLQTLRFIAVHVAYLSSDYFWVWQAPVCRLHRKMCKQLVCEQKLQLLVHVVWPYGNEAKWLHQ